VIRLEGVLVLYSRQVVDIENIFYSGVVNRTPRVTILIEGCNMFSNRLGEFIDFVEGIWV